MTFSHPTLSTIHLSNLAFFRRAMQAFVCSLLCLQSVGALAQDSEAQDTLIVGYNISPPFLVQEDGKPSGPSAWLWEQIAAEHNLAYKLVYVNLDSLLRGLASGNIDIGASPLTITSQRSRSIDFSPPYHIAYSAILVNDISTLEKGLAVMASFFSVNFFRALGILAVVILAFGFMAWFFERKDNSEEFGSGSDGLWSSFWWSAVTMTTVGYGDKSPKTIGGRVVALVWMFTAIVITSSLTASIASSLTVNQIGGNTDAIEDFKAKELGTVSNSGTDEWLRDNFFSNRTTAGDMDLLIKKLENEEIDAIAYDRPILQNIIRRDTVKRFRMLNINYNPQFYAMGFNHRLPEELKKKISVSILQNTEDMDWKILLSEYNVD